MKPLRSSVLSPLCRFMALLSLLSGSLPVRALDELYSVPDAAANGPYTTWASTLDSGSSGARTYDSFSIASDAHVSQVSWTGVYIDLVPGAGAPPPAQTTTWRFGFFANNGGQPGALVHTVDVPAANVTSVHVSNEVWENGNPLERRRYTANLPSPAVLSAGVTYWFSPLSLQPNFNPHFSWWMGTEAGDCFQYRTDPPENIVRPSNRAFTLRGGPPPPGLALSILGNTITSGGNYAVGNVALNATQGVVVRVRNTSTTETLTGITATMTAGTPQFSIATAPPASIAAGGEQNLVFNFTPTTTGTHTGTLQVTSSNGLPSPYLIQLSGGGVDNVAPVITTPAAFISVVDGAPGVTAAVNAWLANHGGAVATDNSGTVNWSHNYSGLPAVGASVVVTFTATDPSGNSATTQANLNLLDQTPPAITAQAAPLTVPCDAANKADLVNAWLTAFGTAAATDNSGSVTWSHNYTGPVPGACGVINVTFTAKDPSNNQSTTQAALTVVDSTAPVLTAPAADLVVESNGTGNATQRNAWLTSRGGAAATDNCGSLTWSHNFTSLSNTLPQTVPVIFSVSDSCGNGPVTTTANFIIQDTTPPVVVTPASDFYGDQATAAASLASFLNTRGGAQATDIAGPVTWTNNYDGTLPPLGGYDTVTFTATDVGGNTVSTTCRFFLFPPGRIWIGPATGVWSLNSNWHGGSGDYYVDLFDFQNSHTTMNGSYSVETLHVGAGDRVDMAGNLTVNAGIKNAGLVRTRAEGDTSGSPRYIYINGQAVFEGPGRFVIAGAARNQFLSGTVAPQELTIAPGHEVTTSTDTYGGYQGSSIHARLVNHGTLTADGGGLNLYSQPKVNDGVFRAINGGYLEIEPQVDNTGGTVHAGAASTVILQNTLTGGTVTGPGTLLINAPAGLTGPMQLDSSLTTKLQGWATTLTGTITNNGVIQFGINSSIPYFHINGPVTLDGSGKVIFQGAGRRQILASTNGATDILTIGAQQEITTDAGTSASYQSSSIHAGVVNHGTITADAGGLTLYSRPKVNNGIMRAINGGFLDIESDVDNTNGTFFAGAGSTLHLESTATGGTITGPGTLLINTSAGLTGPLLLDSGFVTNLDDSSLTLTGAITNNGILHFGSNTSTDPGYIYVNGAVTMDGTGKVILRNAGRRQLLRANGAATDVLTVGPGIEITTDSRTGLNYQSSALHAPMIINGTVTADDGGLTIYSQPKTNNGTMRAINGGYMDFLSVTVTNYNATTDTLTGGRWEVVTNGPATTMDFTSKPIVNLAADTTVRLSGANAAFAQLSTLRNITGTLMLENGKTLATTGNMVIPGKLHYGLPAATNTTRLAITGNVDFTGGTVDIADLGMTTGSYILATWTGSVTGSPTLDIRPPGMTHSLVVDAAAKQLRLEVFVIPQVDITTWTVVPGTGPNAGMNVVTLGGTGHPNAGYVLEATTDLQNWTALSGVLTSPTGAISWQFTEPATLPRRCYRFLLQ